MRGLRWRRRFGSAIVLAVLAVSGAVITPTAFASTPPPGTVLSHDAVPAGQLPPGAAAGERVEYLTRDQSGRLAPSTGIFWTPRGTPPVGGWKVVSWAHGTTGIADQCAPSRTKTGRAVDSAVIAALEAGYAVTATDYAGLGSPEATEYLGGKAAAHSVIDMVRAARSRNSDLSVDWVSMGHSQGGHAALFAGRYAGEYAPELHLREVIALAPASGIESVFAAFAPHVPSLGRANTASGLLLFLLAGLDHARPDLKVIDHLTTDGTRYFDLAREKCAGDVSEALRSVSPGSLVARAFTDRAFTDALRDYTAVPASGWKVPIRIDHGLLDPVVPYPLSLALVRRLRDGGADVTLTTHLRADHTDVVGQSLGADMDSVRAAFARD